MGSVVDDDEARKDVGVPEGSVLFVSAHITPDHDNYGMYRPKIDPPPDFDLNRLLDTAGRWTRKYFHPTIIEAASNECIYPKSPDGLSAVVIGGSLAHLSAARGPLASWQEELIEFVRKCILDWDLGFLGLCGGGQIGLCALGGTVKPNPPGLGTQLENLRGNELVRTGELLLTEAGRIDPIFLGCPPRLAIQEDHGDYFAEVPEGMAILAESPDIPNQVLGWHDRVRLFQPHPELSLSLMRRLLHELAGRADTPQEARRVTELSLRLRETPIANDRIVPNFLAML
jgi:GMP synthase-like glutamine amidotransferase